MAIDDGLMSGGPTGPHQGPPQEIGPPKPISSPNADPYDVSDDDAPVPEKEPDDSPAPVADNNA